MILLVTGSSTDPTLFHASCRSGLHVGLLRRLYLTLSQNGLPSTYIWSCRNQSYNHIRKETPNTHIWPCGNTSHNPVRKAQHSHPSTNVGMAQHIHSTMRGTNPPCRKALHLYLTTNVRKSQHLYSTHERNQSNMHVQKGSTLTFDTCEEPIQHACSKRIYTYIRHMRGTKPKTN